MDMLFIIIKTIVLRNKLRKLFDMRPSLLDNMYFYSVIKRLF